jgi:hypothetical protein
MVLRKVRCRSAISRAPLDKTVNGCESRARSACGGSSLMRAVANSIANMQRVLESISYAKIKHLAAEARALHATNLWDFTPPKRFGHYELDLQTIPQPVTDDLLFEIILPDNSLPPLLGTETSASG